MPSDYAYRTDLTFKDETVDDGFIPIYELFSDSKYALPTIGKDKWCINENKLRRMRLETYREIKKRCELCGATSYAKFWNGNLDSINELGLNKFAYVAGFGELANIMLCFEKKVKNQNNDKYRRLVSWGIRKSTYREYYMSQREALETGNPPKEVRLYEAKKKRAGNVFKQAIRNLEFKEDGKEYTLHVNENAVYRQFEHWCKIKGIEKKNGIYQAMRLIMEEEPVTSGELKELGAYERKCDLDYSEILIPETTGKKYIEIRCSIPKSVHTKMKEIIKRHNSDIDNIGKPCMTVDKYLTQSVELLNQKAPLKYSNPELYEKYIEAKEAQEYNKMVAEKKVDIY